MNAPSLCCVSPLLSQTLESMRPVANLTSLLDVTGRHNYGRTFCPGIVSPELTGSSFISIGHGEVNGIMPGHSVSSAPLMFETALTDADCAALGSAGVGCTPGSALGLVPVSFM